MPKQMTERPGNHMPYSSCTILPSTIMNGTWLLASIFQAGGSQYAWRRDHLMYTAPFSTSSSATTQPITPTSSPLNRNSSARQPHTNSVPSSSMSLIAR